MKQSTKYLRYITGVLVVAFVVAMAAFPAKAIAEDDYDTTVELQALSEQSAPDVQMQALEAQAAEPSAPYDTAIQEQASTQTTVVQFVDEDGKSLGNITGYGSEGTKYTTKGKGKQSLVDLVNNKISDLAKRHYEVKSSNFDQNGSYKATNETCTIVMKAINGAGTEQTIVVKFVDRYTQTTINVPTGKEGVLSVGEVRLTGTAGYTVSESGMESINEMKDKIVAAGYTLVSMGQVNANLTFDFDVNSDQSYYVTFQGHITSVQNPQDVIYTGTALKPSPLVKQNNIELTPGKDYSLSYSNNVNVGTARVTITGAGAFKGQSRTASFKIKQASIESATVTLTPSSYIYDGTAKKPAVKVVYGNMTLQEGRDYSLKYANNTGSSSADTTASVTVSGKANFTGTKSVNFKIVAPAAQSKDSLVQARIQAIPDQFYTGKEVKPQPTISYKGKTLKLGVDYTLSYVNNIRLGRAVLTATGKGDYVQTISTTFNIVSEPVAMYRLYNRNSGEHFYTASPHERDVLKKAGWRYEGIGWYAPKLSSTPVYRLYNPNAGDHHYTISKAERDNLVRVGWRDEGIGWYSDDLGGVALYRQYNPNAKAGAHNYTTSKAENDMLVRAGWRYEGIGWYGLKK